jgi:hypothetical protein
MRTSAFVFVLVALLLWTAVASSIAIEREKFEIHSGWTKDKSPVAAATANDAKAIARLIDDINAAVQKDKRRMLSVITINTDVAGTTLEQEKARTGLSFGDIYVAHSLALATRRKFDHFVALKAGGQSWAQIARAHKVSLKGRAELLKEMMKQ